MIEAWTAVILAGGTGSRLGGVDKANVTIGGTTALDRLVSSLPAEVPVVVAGPPAETRRSVQFVLESPPGGGPVAGINAAMALVETPLTALLATDMPLAGPLIAAMAEEFTSVRADALVPVDGAGMRQPLCSIARTPAIRAALSALGATHGRSLHALLAQVDVQERPLSEAQVALLADFDTVEDLQRLRRRLDT